jgi:hypothetical protein
MEGEKIYYNFYENKVIIPLIKTIKYINYNKQWRESRRTLMIFIINFSYKY